MHSSVLLGILHGKEERDTLIARLDEFSMGYAMKSKVHSLVCSWIKDVVKEQESLKWWWESRRPEGWTEEQHLAEPLVGLESLYDTTNATKVAESIIKQNKLKEIGQYL